MLTRNALDWAKLLAAASKVARTVAYPPSSVYPPLDTVPKHDAVPGPIVSTPAAGTVSGSYDHGVDLNEVENGRLEKETAFESTGNRNRSPMEPKFNEPSWAETSGSDLNISSADSLETADVPSRVGAAAENMLDRPALRSSAVPTGRLGRLFRYGGLALGVGYGTATEAVRRIVSPGSHGKAAFAKISVIQLDCQFAEGNIVLNEQNMDRFVDTLSRMRGAALKLGQMLSIQGL